MFYLDNLGLQDNYYALIVAILTKLSVDRSISCMSGHKPEPRKRITFTSKDEDDAMLAAILKLRIKGMKWREIGQKVGIGDARSFVLNRGCLREA